MRFCDVDWYARASRPSSSPRVSFVAFPRPHAPGHKRQSPRAPNSGLSEPLKGRFPSTSLDVSSARLV